MLSGAKYLFVIVVAPAAVITALFFGAPASQASPTDTGVANNTGLQQLCAFNPAFERKHHAACLGFDVEAVASNDGSGPVEPPPPPAP